MSFKTKQEAFAAMQTALATIQKFNAPLPPVVMALVSNCVKIVAANTKIDVVTKVANEKTMDDDSGEAEIVGDTIIIRANLIFYGTATGLEFCSQITCEIEEMFNAPNAVVCVNEKEYKTKFVFQFSVITVKEADNQIRNNTDIENNYIRIENKPKQGNVDRSFMALGGNNGFWLVEDDLGKSTTAPHEMGHGLGLDHSTGDQRNGIPDIMAARGTLVDKKYQWDPKADLYKPGATLNPYHRKVTQKNIEDIIKNLTFDKNGKADIGKLTNTIYNSFGAPGKY